METPNLIVFVESDNHKTLKAREVERNREQVTQIPFEKNIKTINITKNCKAYGIIEMNYWQHPEWTRYKEDKFGKYC